ncbi:MAG: L-lysine 6-transaminase [Polyangiaceae bacterium]|nr:L-lysine 6-transaminase [Polyangiaceae bacterium]MCW5791184.1 L-lysine 6-transaminase [Polyangiaceae bacterium]
MYSPIRISPESVHDTLRRHLLVDGYPMVVDLERSQGSLLRDARTGRELLDFFSFFASNPIGFNHPKMTTDAVRQRLSEVSTMRVSNSDYYTTYMAEFVATLERTAAPDGFPYYFFIDGGALAVENAMKTAFDWKVRKNLQAGKGARGSQVLHLERAFHGRSGYTLSVTNTDPVKTDHFPKFPWPRISSPAQRFPVTPESTQAVAAAEAESLAAARRALIEADGDVAAILLEPIQAEGGDNHFRTEYLSGLRALADEFEALLIFDEVQTGLGMTGTWWAFQQLGVVPDIVCFAKKMQVGGIFVSPRIDDVEEHVFRKSSRINSTWGASLVDMVRCTRILEIMEEDQVLANVTARGEELLTGLRELEARVPEVTGARGRGLMCAIDLPSAELRGRVVRRCFEEGMVVLPCGTQSVRFRPTLTVTAEVIAEGVARLGRAIEHVLRG